jgi:hypothetical protein
VLVGISIGFAMIGLERDERRALTELDLQHRPTMCPEACGAAHDAADRAAGCIFTRPGSCLVVPLTPGGGALSDVKLKKQDQELTLGFEGRLAPGKRPYAAATSDDGA